MIETRPYARDTSLTQQFPWGTYIKARALCADGRVRTTKRMAITADTFFSVPAAVEVAGRTVSGYITVECLSGSSVPTPDDPAAVKFIAYQYRANADALPRGAYKEPQEITS